MNTSQIFNPNQSENKMIHIKNSVWFNPARIYSDWNGINRVKSDWLLTIFYQTRFKIFLDLFENRFLEWLDFVLIRALIDSDWKLGFELVQIHSDSCPGLNRIRLDRFFKIFHQMSYETFFGFLRNDSHWLGCRYRNELELFWLAQNEFQSNTFDRVVWCKIVRNKSE